MKMQKWSSKMKNDLTLKDMENDKEILQKKVEELLFNFSDKYKKEIELHIETITFRGMNEDNKIIYEAKTNVIF